MPVEMIYQSLERQRGCRNSLEHSCFGQSLARIDIEMSWDIDSRSKTDKELTKQWAFPSSSLI